jgi:hypothetical protein
MKSSPQPSRIQITAQGYCLHAPVRSYSAFGWYRYRRLSVKLVEPPSCTLVFIGRNSRGQWVAQQQDGLFGGLFATRAAAVRYALFENGHHLEAIISISSILELNMGSLPPATAHAPPTDFDADRRRVA